MPNLLKDEFTTRMEGDKIIFRRVLEEEFDAEEYLRQLKSLEQSGDRIKEQLEKYRKELKEASKWREKAEKIREKEIEKVREEVARVHNESRKKKKDAS